MERSRCATPTLVLYGLLSCLVIQTAWESRAQADVYLQTNLVSNTSGNALLTDANLKDPWGISFSTASPFWVSDQASNVGGMSVTTLYRVNGTTGVPSIVPASFGIPNLGNAPPDPAANGPTGQVNTSAPGIKTGPMDFLVGTSKANFIFANMDGSISGWNGGSSSTIMAHVAGASFTGLAIANDHTGAAFLYAADQNSGNVYRFDSHWHMAGTLTDPQGLPAGYTAFNVQNIGGQIYVAFTNPNSFAGGIIDVFKPEGTFVARRIDDQNAFWLNSPWGMTLAPRNFGQFSGDLLIGNNGGNGWINAFDPFNGNFLGVLTLSNGQPFSEGNLWSLTFGNGRNGGMADALYFTAGITNTDGLLGVINNVPEPSSLVITVIAGGMVAAVRRIRRHRSAKPL
jgi:uncharacterized protein (TIGR03118 family)